MSLNIVYMIYFFRYSLLIEDDAIPNPGFFDVLDHVITSHIETRMMRGDRVKVKETILYVKLYHPERLLGYIQPEPDRLTELCGIGFVLGTFSMLLYWNLIGYRYGLSYSKEMMVYGFMVLYFMAAAECIGRPHLLQFRMLFTPYLTSFMRAPECCTPAMLFPNGGAEIIARYLDTVECKKSYGKDMAIETFRRANRQYKTYMVQPNLVTHIGLYSSLRKAILDPFVV